MFNGLNMNLGDLPRLAKARTRSISPENFTGAKGEGGKSKNGPAAACARDLGRGWKISPYVELPPHSTFEMANISGPGSIQHIWLTPTGHWRFAILRIFWDDCENPAVECPVGDFFACGWGEYAQVSSQPVCVNPGSAFNCYWPMPFRRRCRVTLENIADEPMKLYYQITYAETTVPDDAAYFHAQFRRINPSRAKKVITILDGVEGEGHYVGTYIAWGVNNNGWWGEGELKFFLDGDRKWPTICYTGTEDYFCGSYNFENPKTKQYQPYTTAYAGLPQVIKPDGLYQSQQRFGMYRWHIMDPIRFTQNLRVTLQALGWRSGGRYLSRQDDIATVAFWYQKLPSAKFPKLPSKDQLEII